jgi:hydroxyacylglutathione hydrolase
MLKYTRSVLFLKHHTKAFFGIRSASLISAFENDKFAVKYRPVGPFQMNQYLLICKQTKNAAIIDSGENPDICFGAAIDEDGLTVSHLIQTHAHIDHVSGLHTTAKKYPQAKTCLHKEEHQLYDNIKQQIAMFGVPCDLPLPTISHHVEDGDVVTVGSIDLRVLFTPGHSPGGCVYFHEGSDFPFAFVGDLIFQGSIGRTDLPGSDQRAMKASVRRVAETLPKNTILLPGHNDTTTMGEESEYNPFIVEWTRN